MKLFILLKKEIISSYKCYQCRFIVPAIFNIGTKWK